MPRAFSSGALSIWSYALNSPPCFSAITLVSAAVSVVLPWSTCPIVPTLTCGLVRSNLLFAIFSSSLAVFWCPWRGSNARPLPYQGSALPLSHMGGDGTHLSLRRARGGGCSKRLSDWSGRRESNPRHQLGRLGFYH